MGKNMGKWKEKWKDISKKFRLDKRVAVILACVAAAACILLVLQLYTMRQVTVLELDAAALPGEGVLTSLREHSLEKEEVVWLEQLKENEVIYRRGNVWFAGEERREFAGTAPLYVNDGAYLWLLGVNDARIFDEDWQSSEAAAGMYISAGKAFNFDGSATGDPTTLFLRLSNGIFLNTVSLQAEGAGKSLSIPTGSYLDLKEDGIYYLARQAGEKLIYSEFPASFGMQITINGETISYEELLMRLGILQQEEDMELPGEEPEEDPAQAAEDLSREDDTERDEDSTGNTREDAEAAESETDEEQSAQEPGERENGTAGDTETQETSGAAGTGAESGAQGDSQEDGSQSGSGEEDDESQSGSGEENEGSQGGSGEENDESQSGSGEEEDGSQDGSGEGDDESQGGSGEGSSDDDFQNEGAGEGQDNGDGNASGDAGQGGSETPGTSGGTEAGGGGSAAQPGGDDVTDGDESEEEAPGDEGEEGTEGNEGEPGSGESSSEPIEGDVDGTGGGSGSGTAPGEVNPPVWTKPVPEIVCESEDVSIYSLEATLRVRDTYGCFDRVVLMLSWDLDDPNDIPDENTQLQLRRTLRERGDFSIDSLPPGEKIFVSAYLYYYAEDGTKIQETEPFQTFVIETKPFENVDPMFVNFSDALEDSESGWYYENQIETYDLKLSSPNSNVLSKIYRAQLEVYRKENISEPLAVFNITSGTLNRYKTLQGLDYQTLLSQYVLPANTQYRYRFEFFDRYGNSFNEAEKVLWGETQTSNPESWIRAEGYGAEGELYEPETSGEWTDIHEAAGADSLYWGYTHTSKTVPSAAMQTVVNPDKLTTLSDIGVTIQVDDPHNALTPDAGGSLGTVLGEVPQSGGRDYRVYLSLSNTQTGENIYFTCQDENGKPILTVGETDDDGVYHRYDEDTAGAALYAYVQDGSLPSGNGSKEVEFRGLTAGETYTIRIFATYDLNDSHPELTGDVEIGNMRFSTTSMTSYGRIYYRISAEHIMTAQPEGVLSYDHEKYESSTAQMVTMEINTARTTQPVLVNDFFNRLEVELKHRSGLKDTLAKFYFDRDQGMERVITVNLSELDEGWYTVDLAAGTDYTVELSGSMTENRLPAISLQVPVSDMFAVHNDGNGTEDYYSFSLWEALCGIDRQQADAVRFVAEMPKLAVSFDEGSLESYTGYTLSAASVASQGGREHTVTASSSSFRQVNFTTLKDMPFVTLEDMLQVGSNLYLVGLEFHDYNEAIRSGAVTITNTDKQTGSEQVMSYTLDYSEEGGWIANVDIGGLRNGRTYELKVLGNDIRRSGSAASYRYQNEVLYTYEYVAGEGVSGQIRLNSLTFPLKNLSNGEQQHVLSEYSKYEPGNFEYGIPSIVNGSVSYSSQGTYYQTATPIAVNPGEIYYLHNLSASSSNTTSLILLDGNQHPVGSIRTIYSESYIRIPEGVDYIQFLMQSTMASEDGRTVPCSALAQAIKIYDAADEQLLDLGLIKESGTAEGISVTVAAGKGEKVAVTNSEWTTAAMTNSQFTATYDELDQSGTVLRTGSLTCYPGASFEVKSDGAASVRINFNGTLLDHTGAGTPWQVRVIDTDKLAGFADMLFDNLVTNYTASVQDSEGSLYAPAGGDNIRVRVYSIDPAGSETEYTSECYTAKTGGYREDASSGVVEYVDGSWENTRSFKSETGYTYRITLSIVWRGTEYELDSVEVEATGNIYTISTAKQLLKTVAWPTASFLVLDDLDVDSITRSMIYQYRFQGNLDGDGHSLDYTTSSNSGWLFSSLGSSGVIENLEINYGLNGRTNRTRLINNGFIGTNYGTIRNVVLRYSLGQGNYRHTDGGGFCRWNLGTIENFAVYFTTGTGDSNALGGSMGGVCNVNRGVIRNGFVYSSSILRVTTGTYGGTTDVGITSTGGVCGSNETGGLIENVYAMLSMGVEQNANAAQIGGLSGWGLIAGSNGGMIRNCFTNGEIYYQAWERDAAGSASLVSAPVNTYRTWPGTYNQGRSYEDNCYYYSGSAYLRNDVYTQYISSPATLQSAAFYHGSVNRDNAFVVEEQLNAGYYPIVDMPECMDGVQTSISLGSSGMGAYPSYLSSALVRKSTYLPGSSEEAVYYEGDILPAEEAAALKGASFASGLDEADWDVYLAEQADGSYRVQQQFALVQFIFSNAGGYDLSGLVVNGLTTVQLSADREEFSTVTALLTPGTWENTNPISYGNSYELTSYTYGMAGMSRVVTLDDRFVNVQFYYPLSQKSWSKAPVSATQVINYRLTEDVHFAQIDSSDYTTALNKFYDAPLMGEFDGGGYCLDYTGVGERTYIFGDIATGAQMHDLYVSNLTLGGTNAVYLGFIRQTAANVVLSGIHLENVNIQNAYRYAGSLAAYTQNATIEDCTAAGVTITSSESAQNLYVGGLVGCNASGTSFSMRNSFARELDLDTTAGISVSGTGGLIGYAYRAGNVSMPTIQDCYAQGDINSRFSYCGGIAGRANGAFGSCWTAVNIYGSNYVGAMSGYVLASGSISYNVYNNMVVSGELYTSSGTVDRRLVGLWESSAASISNSYAYEGQLINSETSEDLMDVKFLSDADTMKEYYFWTDQAALGDAWHLYGATEEEYGAEIPDVKADYVYPLLYTEDGSELLPDQTAVYYKLPEPEFELTDATAELLDAGNHGTYDLRVTVQMGGGTASKEYFNQYLKDQVSAEGLQLAAEDPEIDILDSKEAYQGYQGDADVVMYPSVMVKDGESIECVEVVYREVEALNRWDSYLLRYEDEDGAKVARKLIFHAPGADPSLPAEETAVPLYWYLSTPADWTQLLVTEGHGSLFENFKLVNDLNLTGNTQLGESMKINRLEGTKKVPENYELRSAGWRTAPEFTSIQGVEISTGGAPWIAELSGRLGEIHFKDIGLREVYNASYFGLIGQMTGNAEYVDFSNIVITTGTGTSGYSYLGCIGYASGEIENIRLNDIKIQGSTTNAYYYSYAGGLAGYARQISKVYAFGTDPGLEGYKLTLSGTDTSVAGNYYGGIVGYVSGSTQELYGKNLQVTGKNSTGGLMGYLNGAVDTGLLPEPSYEAQNVKVTGFSQVGGILGGATWEALSNARVTGAEVEARQSGNAGGVMGNAQPRYCEAYDVKVTAAGTGAGGITGYSAGGAVFCKAADVEITGAGNVGGIMGSGYGTVRGCAVTSSEEENPSTVTAQSGESAGGIVGRIYQNTVSYSRGDVYSNAVSRTEVTAASYAGGIAGRLTCSRVYYNEADDSVTVTVTQSAGGGVAGELAGCVTYNNITGAAVGSANNIGGIAGQVVGYANSTTAGGSVSFHVSQMYGNLAVNKSVTGINYVAGLVGLFESGDRVYDPETGEDISEEAGWTQYMSNRNFHSNTLAMKTLETSNADGSYLSWYANYSGTNSTFSRFAESLYDCILNSLVTESENGNNRLKLPNRTPGIVGSSSGLTIIASDTLKSESYYTQARGIGSTADQDKTTGGPGFSASYLDMADLGRGFYPYLKAAGFTVSGQPAQYIRIPYQTSGEVALNGGGDWNTTGSADGDVFAAKMFDGDGILIEKTAGISLFSLETADNIAYASGINTLNLDFTNIDSDIIGFKILDAYGNTLVDDTTLESAAGSGKVCTMTYDFQTDIAVVLYSADHREQKIYPYQSDQLRSTVMTWNDGYYYLKSDGVYRVDGDGEAERVAEGAYVHLYEGQALGKDRTVADLP